MLYALYDSFGVKRMESSHLRLPLNRSNTFNKSLCTCHCKKDDIVPTLDEIRFELQIFPVAATFLSLLPENKDRKEQVEPWLKFKSERF